MTSNGICQIKVIVKDNNMKKNYRGHVNNGVLSAVHAVTEAESAYEAIEKIKGASYRFHISENVSEDTDLRGYIKSQVESGKYIWIGPKPHWW
jgi:hypothetical protein